tara:strand:+ start:412 stop:612 length:201 start_codon:yes stop_codon:yes gene_type:complete
MLTNTGGKMTPIKKILGRYKSVYAAAKALDVNAMQLSRLSKAEAQADETGQVWIKSKTVIKMEKKL